MSDAGSDREEASSSSIFKSVNIEDLEQDVREAILTWFAIEKRLKEIADVTKELRTEKKEIEDKLLQFMEQKDEEVIMTSSGNIMRHKMQTKAPINEELINTVLYRLTQDQEKAVQFTSEIVGGRTVKERVMIKKQMIRRKGGKKKAETS